MALLPARTFHGWLDIVGAALTPCTVSCLLLVSAPTLASSRPPAAARPIDAASLATTIPTAKVPLALPDLPAYTKEIESIRMLPFKEPVLNGTQSLAEFRQFIQKDIDHDLPPPRAACVSRSLGLLGLLPEHFDLRNAFSQLLVTQVAAYYNPYKKMFFIVHPELPDSFLKPTVVHELTHALQDQQFGLEARIKALRKANNDDMENAFRFLAEGEATYVMMLSTLRGHGFSLEAGSATIDQAIDAMSGLGREGIIAQVESTKGSLGPDMAAEVDTVLSYPDFLFRILFDPYFSGQKAVHHVFRNGGWDAVNGLWTNPPTSTELFLHPEKLEEGTREEPVSVRVPDLSSALGPGYASGCENTLGELETEILFETTLPEQAVRMRDPASSGSSGPPAASDDSSATAPRAPSGAGTSAGAAPSAGAPYAVGPSTAAPSAPPPPAPDPSSAPLPTGAPSAAHPSTSPPRTAPAQPPVQTMPAEPQTPSSPGVSSPPSAGVSTLSTPDRVERAKRAAAGWGGDRYRTFEKDGGGTIVVWKTVWDTEQDAIEFEEALCAASRARLGSLDTPGRVPTPSAPAASPGSATSRHLTGTTTANDGATAARPGAGTTPPATPSSASSSSASPSSTSDGLSPKGLPPPAGWIAADPSPAGNPSNTQGASTRGFLLVRQGKEALFVAGADAGQARAILAALAPAPPVPPASR